MAKNTKFCNKCSQTKDLNEFYFKPRISHACKPCIKRQQIEAHYKKLENDPQYLEKRKAASQKFRNEHRNEENFKKANCTYTKKHADANKNNPEYIAGRKAAAKRFRENNKGKVNAWNAKRKAQKLKATPKWLSEAQLDEIKDLYILASELSWLSEGGLQVDHIVPLLGENVRGLHVPWNLQIIPAIENNKKNNKIN